MGKRAFSITTFSPAAVADTANYTNDLYMGVQGGTSIQRVLFFEFYFGGQAAASSPMYMLVARDSTVAATSLALGTGFNDAALDPAMASTGLATAFTQSTTKPQRSSSLHLLNLTFNAFGGIVRWVAAPGEEVQTVGNTASLGELSVSNFTGGTTAAIGGHIIYEAV